jgi:hypothetical protein
LFFTPALPDGLAEGLGEAELLEAGAGVPGCG